MTEQRLSDGTVCRVFAADGGVDGGADGGADGEKATIVLIHGLGLNQAMWRHQLEALAVNFRVVTYDLYGHGQSIAPPETPDLSLFARQFATVVTELGLGSVIVAGFSLGGMIARRIAMDYPERVAAVAILHSPHARTEDERAAIQKRVHQAALDGPGATVDAALERWFTAPFRIANPEVMGLVRDWVMANDRAIYPGIYQVLVDGVDELVAPHPPISCPALVMTGDEDFGNNPAMSASIAAEIAGSELVVLKGLRHMAMLEAPEIFNDHLIKFCDRV